VACKSSFTIRHSLEDTSNSFSKPLILATNKASLLLRCKVNNHLTHLKKDIIF